MPGYHKSYPSGTGKAKKPSTYLDTALTREQMKERERMQNDAKSLFFQTLPANTPEEARVARQYPGELPYDDDAPAPGSMRMVKNNLTGRQMKIAKQTPPFDEINGADFKKLREMLMGRGMANAKTYQDGSGDMGGDSTMGAAPQEPGVFSTGINEIGAQFNQLRDGVLNQLKPKDFEKLKEKGIDPQEADVWDVINGLSRVGGVDSSGLLYRASRMSGVPLPPASARQIYDRVKEGRMDPAKFDSALSEKGYGTGPDGEQAAQIFTQALTSGRLPLAQMVTASKTDDKGDRVKHEYRFADYLKTMPTGYEFLEQNKKMVNRKGELKGDDYLSFPLKSTKQSKDIMTPRPTEMGGMEGLAQQEPELPKDIQGDVVEQRGPVNPMETLPTEVPTKRPDPKPVVEQRPDPVAEERIKPGPPPESDPLPPSDTPPGGPLGTFDLGMNRAMPSDKTGSLASGAMGRYSDAVLGQQFRNRAGINRMGSALRAKLNAMGRKYNKYTMGTRNPRGMRFVKRQ